MHNSKTQELVGPVLAASVWCAVCMFMALEHGVVSPLIVMANMVCRGYDIAALAAGGSIALVDATLDGTIDNGYALVR